jgi:hypothetical protein
MLRKASYVTLIGLFIAFAGYLTLARRFPVGPVVFALGFVPIVALIVAKRHLKRAIPDLIFGAIDTGLLTIPALIGGLFYGVAGAITGGIIGDALWDRWFFRGFYLHLAEREGDRRIERTDNDEPGKDGRVSAW